MNPSNVLTIAQNVKSGLKEYITSTYLKKEIDENYEKLKLDLSRLDADIKEDIENLANEIYLFDDGNIKKINEKKEHYYLYYYYINLHFN